MLSVTSPAPSFDFSVRTVTVSVLLKNILNESDFHLLWRGLTYLAVLCEENPILRHYAKEWDGVSKATTPLFALLCSTRELDANSFNV